MSCQSGYLATPNFLTSWEHAVTLLSMPIHVFGFYCILHKTPSSMSTVRWSLLNLHLWTICLDYSFSFLVIPFILWPRMGGVPLGVLQYTGMSTAAQFYLLMVLMGLVSVSILSMFEGRFTILFVKPDNFWSRMRLPWLLLHYIASFLYMAPPFLRAPEQSETVLEAFENFPCLPVFLNSAPLFILSLDIVYSSCAVCVFTVDIVLEVLFFVSLIYRRIIGQLKAHSMSTKTFRLQRMLLLALFVQVLIPLNVFIVPIVYVVYSTIFGHYNQAHNNVAIAVASTHGICSTVTMILIHRPYRIVVFGCNSSPVRTEINSTKVSVVQMS